MPNLGTFDPWTGWPDLEGFRSRHSGGAFFTWCDGHVSFLGESIDINTYHYLSTRAGGEIAQAPD
jgi:prepilin-type processing-associated H-X9-DG protein